MVGRRMGSTTRLNAISRQLIKAYIKPDASRTAISVKIGRL